MRSLIRRWRQGAERVIAPRPGWQPSLSARRSNPVCQRLRQATAWLVAFLYFTGVRPVSAAAFDGTPQERAAAIQAAGYARDASALSELAKAALDRDPVIAYAAAEALGAIGTEAAADELLKAWACGSTAGLANGLLRCAEARRKAGDAARARALYAACEAKGTEAQKAAARAALAALDPASAAEAKPPPLVRLRDESSWVRLPAMREAVRSADVAALPALFELSLRPDEDGRAATLALSAFAAKETDAFLYGEMRKAGPGRAKAVELLAARGNKELARRLCDASLYDAPGAAAAAGSAWRACLTQEEFAAALAFAFGPPPEKRREPLASALAVVAQQLPDQARVLREIGAQLARAESAAKADLLGLLAGLPSEGARDLLCEQMTSDDAERRKATVRVFAKWSTPLAVAPLAAAAKTDADRSVKILALRSVLALVQKPGVVAKPEKLALLAELAAAAERAEERKALLDGVKATGGKEADALHARLAEAFGLTGVAARVIAAVNAGGPEVGAFRADGQFVGGSVHAAAQEADLDDASDAAPAAVYRDCRFRDSVYTFDGLKADAPYTLRLHFAETFHERPGARVFDVTCNGRPLLTDYDILVKAGKKMKAVTETFDVAADAAGKLTVAFKTKRDQALVNGLEILEGSVRSVVPRPAGKPGRPDVLLLTGANNHDWRETTAALRAVFAESPTFAVAVAENPWDMKPGDLEGYELVFSNWNTWGKDKREWTAQMKAAFMAWVKRGGGFFVLHAGASLFYDWDEFQSLTGGSWEKGTFHPHRQAFTVNISDKGHPVTRGLADFEIFDEPWQRVANRNPARQVLLTGVVSKENKGSGEPEPFAWTTRAGQGRCFNLVLGHDARAITNASCKKLILRGAEWAATGDVK